MSKKFAPADAALSAKKVDPFATACALRDFFIAKNSYEMALALRELDPAQQIPAGNTLEYDFNRLFTGPAPPEAPPWASIYLEKEPRLMGEATIEMRKLGQALGLEAQPGLPEDWLPLELELWLALSALEDPAAQAHRHNLETHMLSWIPAFAERALESAREPAIVFVVTRLMDWLSTRQK